VKTFDLLLWYYAFRAVVQVASSTKSRNEPLPYGSVDHRTVTRHTVALDLRYASVTAEAACRV